MTDTDLDFTHTEMSFDQIVDQFGASGSAKEWLYDWKGANEWLFRQINSFHTAWYDPLMIAITHIGKKENFPYYLGALLVCMVFSFLIRKIQGRGGNKHHAAAWFGVFVVLLASFVVNGMIIGYSKNHFAMPRPYVALAGQNVVQLEDRPVDDNYHSFPSGHVGFTTMMVLGLWPLLSRRLRQIGLATIFAVGWSRLALGVHFPADVVGGFLLALVVVLLVRAVCYWLLSKLFGLHC